MKVEKRSGDVEREILRGMIASSSVCGRIASRWTSRSPSDGLFSSKWSNLIANWCVSHHGKHGKAPRDSIQSVFARWAETARDQEAVKLVEEFLGSLSSEHEKARKINADHVIDIAGEHFRLVQARKFRDRLDADLAEGRLDDVESAIASYGRIEMGAGKCIDLLQDMESLKDAFTETAESIVKYPAPMERFLRGAMEQDGFISFLAPNKTGKSWFLEDFAWRAMCQRRRVAYFQVGDMSRRRVTLRLAIRASRHPGRAPDGWPMTVRYPKKLQIEDGQGSVIAEDRVFTKPLSFAMSQSAFEKIAKRMVRSGESYFKLWTYPNLGVSIKGIGEELRVAGREGWNADCVVIDYADNLAPVDHKKDFRLQINETWSLARALSLERHVLVVTATQADSASFGSRRLLSRENFTDSRTKLDHPTGMLGINVTPEDKAEGIARLNWVNLREGDFDEREFVACAGCLAIGNPIIQTLYRGQSR